MRRKIVNKRIITLSILGLLIAATAYLAYNSISGLEEFDFEEAFEEELDNEFE